jgi:hypothetical protein
MDKRTIRRAACALLASVASMAAMASVDIGGVPVDETAVVDGKTLVLNGAGYRKRGYFKVDVTALYLQGRYATLDAIEKAPGAKRLQLILQQDITGTQASRFFLTDFEAAATPQEFAQLITEVSQVGAIYSALPKIKKGDVVTMDVVPGKGSMASLNGTPLIAHGMSSPWFANELLGRVLFRMYLAGKTPPELRDNLMGVSYSMRDKPPTPAEIAAANKAAATPTAAPATVPARAASAGR